MDRMDQIWENGVLNKEALKRVVDQFIAKVENPAKVATRAEFEQVKRDFQSFVENRLI
jgi:hypothetical protein